MLGCDHIGFLNTIEILLGQQTLIILKLLLGIPSSPINDILLLALPYSLMVKKEMQRVI